MKAHVWIGISQLVRDLVHGILVTVHGNRILGNRNYRPYFCLK